MSKTPVKISAKQKLLEASLGVIRTKGYSATTVDELCEHAGVTKGAFFHHFDSKEALAVAAAQHWSTVTTALFTQAAYRKRKDPLDRLLGYIDLRSELIRGQIPEFSCFVGTMVQETFDTSPKIRAACEQSIFGHATDVAKDIAAAKKKYAPNASWDADSVSVFMQAAIQGAYVVSKAKNNPDTAVECIAHLRRYVASLFTKAKKGKRS